MLTTRPLNVVIPSGVGCVKMGYRSSKQEKTGLHNSLVGYTINPLDYFNLRSGDKGVSENVKSREITPTLVSQITPAAMHLFMYGAVMSGSALFS